MVPHRAPHSVRCCLLCSSTAIDTNTDGRFVTTACSACFAVLRIEFDPPDEPDIRARIERLDEPVEDMPHASPPEAAA